MTHPITPPPELVEQWVAEACPECRLTYDEFTGESVEILATRAVQWGADQELEACVQRQALLYNDRAAKGLRAARRPKPPSLKEQALEKLTRLVSTGEFFSDQMKDLSTIRRALEQLDD
jgi:hypothetical protein